MFSFVMLFWDLGSRIFRFAVTLTVGLNFFFLVQIRLCLACLQFLNFQYHQLAIRQKLNSLCFSCKKMVCIVIYSVWIFLWKMYMGKETVYSSYLFVNFNIFYWRIFLKNLKLMFFFQFFAIKKLLSFINS